MPVLTNAEKTAYDAQVTNNTGTSSGTNTGDQNLSALAPIANPTFTGEIGIGTVNVSETELGILEGATATTAELNILDGVTSTAAELNILDGVTSTTAELNLVDGMAAPVDSDITGVTGADVVTNMMSLTQAEYNAITTPDASTFYIIV